MQNTQDNHYDVIVIGAGSGGLTSAVGLAKAGKRVLLVESEHMGGECTNSGCVPSKALLHHAKAYHRLVRISDQDALAYRNSILQRVRATVDEFLAEETPETFAQHGVETIMGQAVLVGPRSVQMGDTTYTAAKIIIATGSSPRPLEIPGLAREYILTNQNVFELQQIPEKLLIVGSGPIGMELGQAFAMLGCKVSMVTIDQRFARLEDSEISPLIEQKFRDLGVDIYLDASVTAVDGQTATVALNNTSQDEQQSTTIDFDKVLIAIGRVPNLPQGLESAGVEYSKHGITVGSHYRTSNRHIYAVGDVIAEPTRFTHTADDAARHVVKKILLPYLYFGRKNLHIPKVTYIEPEVGSVGLSYDEAVKKYGQREVIKITLPYDQIDRAKTDAVADHGMMVVVAKRISGRILGANIAGQSAGEVLSFFSLAIGRKISLWYINSRVVFPYPTISGGIKRVSDHFIADFVANVRADLGYFARKHAPKFFALAFWATLFLVFHEFRMMHDYSYFDVLKMLFEKANGTWWGPVVYMFFYAFRPLIFFPATLLTALSGAIFGLWAGLLYTAIGENMSANFAYWLGRFLGKDVHWEDTFLGQWSHKLREETFVSVLLARFLYFPFDLTNFACGALRARWPQYALATVIGIIPGMTVFVVLGAGIELEAFLNGKVELGLNLFDWRLIAASVGLFVSSLVLARFIKKHPAVIAN